MAKLLLVCALVVLGFALTCYAATTYTVGGNSGWDISTDLPTWASDKKFVVGDVLFKFTCVSVQYEKLKLDILNMLDETQQSTPNFGNAGFQYSSSNSVSQVTKENFEGCNTTNVVKSYSGGNTTVTLTRPGEGYFVSGNKLYCLGGMKLQVPVVGNQLSYAPASSPSSGSDQGPNSNPSTKSSIPTSAGLSLHGGGLVVLILFLSWLFWVL